MCLNKPFPLKEKLVIEELFRCTFPIVMHILVHVTNGSYFILMRMLSVC